MKRGADSANLDWYEGAALMSLDSFAIGGGALRVGRIFNRYPAFVVSGNSRDLGRGRIIPELLWERVAVPVAKWMGVSCEQLATTFPFFNRLNVPIGSCRAAFKCGAVWCGEPRLV